MIVECLIVGTRPLLMNKMPIETLIGLSDKTKKKGKAAAAPSPEKQAASKVYLVDEMPVIPLENFMACLIDAGKYVRLEGKKQVSTGKSTVLPGLLSVVNDVLWLMQPNGADPDRWGVAEWRYDLRQGRNPHGGEAVAIVRPMFSEWAFRLDLDLDVDELSLDAYRKLLDIAGTRVGLCDFRPARKGIFGQFRVDQWKPLAE